METRGRRLAKIGNEIETKTTTNVLKTETNKKTKTTAAKHKTEHSPNLSKKRKIRQDKSTADSENGADISISITNIAHSNNNDEATIMTRALKQVLKLKYVNVLERLKLSYLAKCTRSLKDCHDHHYNNEVIPMSENIITSKTFLNNHHPLMFVHAVQMDVLQTKYPGNYLLHSLFELILGINDSSNEEYEVDNVIDTAVFTINCIFEKFPPCWLAAKLEYQKFITTTKKYHVYGSNELLDNRTLFADIILGLENVIQLKSLTATSSVDDQMGDSFNDTIMLNFQQWESKRAHTFSFDDQKRDVKIDRLFVTLQLFVQLFETDLAMWTIKNRRKTSAKYSSNQKNPLIELVLWANGELNEVNYNIKNILKLYVNYIIIDFPVELTKIIGRLVNMIYNIFELREMQASKTSIEYPSPMQNQSKFCDSFAKIIFEITGCSIDNWLKIIEVVEHPRLKLYLVNSLLKRIDHKCTTLSPKTIYYSLRNIEKCIDDENFGANFQNNNVIKSKVDVPSMKYPCLQKFSRRVVNELSDQHSVELLLTALNSYIHVFHIDEFERYWKNYKELLEQQNEALNHYKTEMNSVMNAPGNPFDLKKMEQVQRKKFDDRVDEMGKTSSIYTLDVMNEEAGITEDLNFQLDIKRYREDLKFVDLIVKSSELKKLREHIGTLFPALS